MTRRIIRPGQRDKIGPTGEQPNGKLAEGDEGEIGVGVGHKEGTVVVKFGTPLEQMWLSPAEAEEFARNIQKHAMLARAQVH